MHQTTIFLIAVSEAGGMQKHAPLKTV